MSDPVICADQTIMDGMVVRWRMTPAGDTVVSASRNAVMIHGNATVTDELKLWILAAEDAHQLLRAGRRDEAKALATHEYDQHPFGRLVPIERAVAATEGGAQ